MRYPAAFRKEAKIAEGMHWKLVTGKHLKWYDQDGILRVTTSMTPRKGNRSTLNARAELRKYGVVA